MKVRDLIIELENLKEELKDHGAENVIGVVLSWR